MLGWPLLWRLAAAMGDSVTGKIGALILAELWAKVGDGMKG